MKILFLILILACSCSGPDSSVSTDLLRKRLAERQKLFDENQKIQPLVTNDSFSFYGLEAIYVSIGRPYYSWIGHVFIRMVGSGKTPDDDLGISFLPVFDDASTDNLKAYYGGYPIFPVVKTWREFLHEYVEVENRTIDRHILLTSKAQRDNFKSTLRKWVKSPTEIGDFSFKRHNCTYWQLKLMKEAGFPVDPLNVVFPINFIYYLQDQKLITHTYTTVAKHNLDLTKNELLPRNKYE